MSNDAAEVKLKAEQANPIEPLLPIEKRLMAASLGLGLALLVVLVALSRLFPAG